jgi:hypothetical protein
MSAVLNPQQQDTSFISMSAFGKVKFLCKLVVFILSMGYVFPRLLVD